jgi:hypothetical protein
MTKVCKACNVEKDIERFASRQTVTGPKLRGTCKDCRNEESRSRRAADNSARLKWERDYYNRKKEGVVLKKAAPSTPETIARQNKSWQLKNKYGLTIEQYETLLALQGNSCSICQEPFSSSKDTHVDHCHTTGFVRGILCSNCNTALGLFKDDQTRLLMAVHYLNQ